MIMASRWRTWDWECHDSTFSVPHGNPEPELIRPVGKDRGFAKLALVKLSSIVLPKAALLGGNSVTNATGSLKQSGRGRSLRNRALSLDKPGRRPGERSPGERSQTCGETRLGLKFLGSEYLYEELFPKLDESKSKNASHQSTRPLVSSPVDSQSWKSCSLPTQADKPAINFAMIASEMKSQTTGHSNSTPPIKCATGDNTSKKQCTSMSKNSYQPTGTGEVKLEATSCSFLRSSSKTSLKADTSLSRNYGRQSANSLSGGSRGRQQSQNVNHNQSRCLSQTVARPRSAPSRTVNFHQIQSTWRHTENRSQSTSQSSLRSSVDEAERGSCKRNRATAQPHVQPTADRGTNLSQKKDNPKQEPAECAVKEDVKAKEYVKVEERCFSETSTTSAPNSATTSSACLGVKENVNELPWPSDPPAIAGDTEEANIESKSTPLEDVSFNNVSQEAKNSELLMGNLEVPRNEDVSVSEMVRPMETSSIHNLVVGNSEVPENEDVSVIKMARPIESSSTDAISSDNSSTNKPSDSYTSVHQPGCPDDRSHSTRSQGLQADNEATESHSVHSENLDQLTQADSTVNDSAGSWNTANPSTSVLEASGVEQDKNLTKVDNVENGGIVLDLNCQTKLPVSGTSAADDHPEESAGDQMAAQQVDSLEQSVADGNDNHETEHSSVDVSIDSGTELPHSKDKSVTHSCSAEEQSVLQRDVNEETSKSFEEVVDTDEKPALEQDKCAIVSGYEASNEDQFTERKDNSNTHVCAKSPAGDKSKEEDDANLIGDGDQPAAHDDPLIQSTQQSDDSVAPDNLSQLAGDDISTPALNAPTQSVEKREDYKTIDQCTENEPSSKKLDDFITTSPEKQSDVEHESVQKGGSSDVTDTVFTEDQLPKPDDISVATVDVMLSSDQDQSVERLDDDKLPSDNRPLNVSEPDVADVPVLSDDKSAFCVGLNKDDSDGPSVDNKLSLETTKPLNTDGKDCTDTPQNIFVNESVDSEEEISCEPCDVTLRNLPLLLTEEELLEILEPYGPTLSCSFLEDDDSKICIVRMSDSLSGELLAASLDGLEVKGHRMRTTLENEEI